jgi:hypothetical protein
MYIRAIAWHLTWSLLPLVFLAAAVAEPPADKWSYIENVPGGTACAARLSGDEIDTMLMLNQKGQLILVAGRAEWHASGPEEIGLRIDDYELEHLQASAFNNLVLLLISDTAVLKRLMAARDLYWTLPSGRYHATVSGLDNALEWIHQCEQGKRLGNDDGR